MTDRSIRISETWYKGIVISVLTFMLIGMIKYVPKAIDAINNRTFDSVTQKNETIEGASRVEVLNEVEKERLIQHTLDQNIHMSPSEKEQLIIIRENQKRIGSDLQEIKNMLKSKHKRE